MTLADLASEPFVLLDEGEQSLVLDAFAAHGLSPHVTSEVTDDYTIMAMVEEGLGVSMLYRRTVEGMRADICVRPIVHAPSRDVVSARACSTALVVYQRLMANGTQQHGNSLARTTQRPPLSHAFPA